MRQLSRVSQFKARKSKRIAFYQTLEGTPAERYQDTSPGTLHFLAWLEKQGHQVEYFILEHDLLEALREEKFDLVAISATEPDFDWVYHSAAEIKKQKPELPLVVGGHIAGGIADRLIYHPAIDAVFTGEAEYTFALFLKKLKKTHAKNLAVPAEQYFGTENLSGYPFKTAYRSPISAKNAEEIIKSHFLRTTPKGRVRVRMDNAYIKDTSGKVHFNRAPNGEAEPVQGELDELVELPMWTTYAKYTPGLMQSHSGTGRHVSWKKTAIYARRGCKGSCGFCTINHKIRTPSVRSVVETLEKTITEYEHQRPVRKPLSISFVDDAFSQSREWALELLGAIREKRLSSKMKMGLQHRVLDCYRNEELDHTLLDAISQNHFDQDLGVETMHAESAEFLGKVRAGQGKRYLEMTKELVMESLKRNTPTYLNAITVNPKSTIESVANDYLQWARVAKEAYEKTGRVFGVQANLRLIPHTISGLTRKMMDNTGTFYQKPTAVDNGKVIGVYYPFTPDGIGAFVPHEYSLSKEMDALVSVIDHIIRSKDQIYKLARTTNYISVVGYSLLAIARQQGNKEVQKQAEEIIFTMDDIIRDKGKQREKRIGKARQRWFETFGKDSLIYEENGKFLDQLKWFENVDRRFLGQKIRNPTRLDAAVDVVISRNPRAFEEYRNSRHGIVSDGYFKELMTSIFSTLTRYAYNFCADDTNDRLDAGRETINELMHADVFYEGNLYPEIEQKQKDLFQYPEYARQAREWSRNGVRFVPPSGICMVDSETGIRDYF